MANFGNGNTEATQDNRGSELRNVIKNRRQHEYGSREIGFEQRVLCDHKPMDGLKIELALLSENTNNFKNNGNHLYNAETTVICTGEDGCGEIFDMAPIEAADLERAVYTINSAVQQIKVLNGGSAISLSDASMSDLRNIAGMLPALTALSKTYASVMKSIAGGKKQQKIKAGGNNKGGIGLPNGNGRMY